MSYRKEPIVKQSDQYTLTADELGLVKPIIETVDTLQKEAQAILRAITRLRGLEGNWNLVGNKLVKAPAGPTAIQQLEPVPTTKQNGN
jgi:hypothetical protein